MARVRRLGWVFALFLGCSPASGGSGGSGTGGENGENTAGGGSTQVGTVGGATTGGLTTGGVVTSGGTTDGGTTGGSVTGVSTTGNATTGGATTGGATTGGATTGGATTGGATTGSGTTGGSASTYVDPACMDGQYWEALPPADTDISAEINSFSPANYEAFVVAVLQKRYPLGAWLVQQTASEGVNGTQQNCTQFFLQGQTSSASSVLGGIGTVVHECGHVYDSFITPFQPKYVIQQDLVFTCSGGSIPQFGGQTFSMSLLNTDEYAPLYPPCESFNDQNCKDSYAGIYLSGDPSDSTFDMGDQGFDTLLEETVQYVNSLAVAYAFTDQMGFFSSSDRDGILTFLWYVQRYLRMARLQYPAAYSLLSQDPCWRQTILTVWGRAWLFLEATNNMPQLGIDDAAIMGLTTDPELLSEIDLLRQAEGCL